ncbi:MAG: HNH endonuclease signature motif containing protein [Pseudoalteromonas distincta]
MTSSTSEDKKSRRINFSPDTKLKLAKSAGFYCSYPGCLIPTTGQTVDDEGKDSAAGIAVAAHIYPASKNGPRKRDGLTPEQIRDISNGIWLCRTHGTLIDDFQDKFPAERVIEMKKVREFAQWLSLKLPEVAFLVGFIGVKRLDAIVWKHWPNPDEEKIRVDVISEGKKCMPASDVPIWTQMPVPPVEFDLKPIPRAASSRSLHSAVLTPPIRRESFPAERRRAIDIVSSWGEHAKRWGWDGKGLLMNNCYVKITARDPESGEIAEPFLWVLSRSTHVYYYNFIDGEFLFIGIDHTTQRASDLNWHLNVTIKDGECCTTSTLRMLRPIRLSSSYERHQHAEFEAYAQVLEKLACGWEPVGYISLEPGEWSEPEKVLPKGFPIRSEITEAQFARALQRCARVKLGYELAEDWGIYFHFSDAFFSDALDETTIRKASKALLAEVGPAPYPISAHSKELVPLNDRYGIRLAIKPGELFFEVAQTVAGIQRNF